MIWLLLAVYIVGYLAAVPRVTRQAINDLVCGDGDPIDYMMCGVLGVFGGLFWPLLAAGSLVGRAARRMDEETRS